ncbi:MAG: hypothetical protein IKL74_05895 [Clostridia bacterium]|nr:hypothetical protein [Clostridia bacterium]
MKTLIINKENPKGIHIEEAAEEAAVIPYEERVVSRIREVYSIDDEFAILRQRDTKPEEFAEYNEFVEKIKAEERIKEVEK